MLPVIYSTQVLTTMPNTIYKTSFEVSIPFAVNLLQIWSRLCTILYEWLIFFKQYCISLRKSAQISIFESSIWVETSHWLERSSSSSATLFPQLPLPPCTHVPSLFLLLHIPVSQLWENKISNDGESATRKETLISTDHSHMHEAYVLYNMDLITNFSHNELSYRF